MTGYAQLTPEIVRDFYGTQPPRTVRGYAYLQEGAPIVIWGFIREPYRWVLFLDAKETVRRHSYAWRRILAAGTRKLKPMLEALRAPVHALADAQIDGSGELLEHLGFEHLTQGVYQWRSSPHSSQPR